MLINRDREKLINMVAFFAANVNFCGKTKLFKLLYFVDFEHFKLTGRSISGLKYFAWKMGPVPTALYDEIEAPEPDMQEKVSVEQVSYKNKRMFKIRAITEFDGTLFTKRELKLLREFATLYKDKWAEDMVEATHLENLPWHKVYNAPEGKQQLIPYELALRSQEKEAMLKLINDRDEFIEAFI